MCRFYAKLSPDALRFCSRIFFDFLSDFFTLQFFIFGDLSCSRSEIKFVGKKNDCEGKEIRAFIGEWLRCQAASLEVLLFAPMKHF